MKQLNNLLFECINQQSIQSSMFIDKNNNYDLFDNSNINSMNTYNALRQLYRDRYDLRSKGKINPENPDIIEGNEENPFIDNKYFKINYINDFSISSVFNIRKNNNFINYICEYLPKSIYSFNNTEIYKNIVDDRSNIFFSIENSKSQLNYQISSNFFSYIIQINPLLYAYMDIDPLDQSIHILDADLFLENNKYQLIFNNENYIMKGNQLCIPFWSFLMDTTVTKKAVYDENNEQIDTEEIYKNSEWLLKDDYTKNFFEVLQNPSKYYQFDLQNDYNDKIDKNSIRTEQDTRSHLFYDDLLSIVFEKIKNYIINDSNKPNDIDKRFTQLFNIINNISVRNSSELDGFPIDQFISLNSYIQSNQNNQNAVNNFIKDNVGKYLINLYKYNYNIVFNQIFRILPYIMSPAYKYKLQSPAMNIMYMVFTILALKSAYYNNKDEYNQIIQKLIQFIDNSKQLNKDNIFNQFSNIFNKEFLIKNLKDHFKVILSILLKNTTFDNNSDKSNSVIYANKIKCFIENDINEEINITIDKTFILLAEFFNKMEKIRYFDASTFCIDSELLKDKNNRRSAKLFAESLLEACYIHMNILGSESFIDNSNNNIINYNQILSNNLIGFDTTRVAKNNINLIKTTLKSNSEFHTNSYLSYIPIINLYTSLAYCIQITIDNLSINNYNIGPYTNLTIKRPQSFWTILKRYALHMTYINNNSYGIWNDIKINSNNKKEIQRFMVSQRIKWLLYGLHLRVWFNDAYFFYTNYKKLMINFNGDVKKAINAILESYNQFDEKHCRLDIFDKINNSFVIPLPNIGLGLAPMIGSYGISSIIASLQNYIDNNEVFVNLIHHGLKDIMVGDSMSCVVDDRLSCIRPILNKPDQFSLNNINNNFQIVFNDINTSKLHEIALSANLSFIFKNIIKKHFINNPNDCMILNNNNINNSYDESFFKQEDQISSYQIAYDNYSWCYKIFENILNSPSKNSYMRLISNIINLYRISVVNYKTWHIQSNDDKKLNNYYNKFYCFSSMLSIFLKEYKHGLHIALSDKSKYGIFDKILKILFTQNNLNNKYKISNIFSNTYNKYCLEDSIVNNSAGGTIYGMYESPMMLMIYNNMDFSISDSIEPTIENIYMLGKDIFAKLYLIMKRLIVDLNFDGKPFDRLQDYFPNATLDEIQTQFINDSIEQFYIVTNNVEYYENMKKDFDNIINNGDINKFISIFAQFTDYDYICNEVCQILNNQYDLNENGANLFINNLINNRKESISLYYSYCKSIDNIENQLNYIINTIIKNKQGSLRKDDTFSSGKLIKEDQEIFNHFNNSYNLSNIQSSINSLYPTTIDDKSGIINTELSVNNRLSQYLAYNLLGMTKELYDKLNDESKKDYDKQVEIAKEILHQNNQDYTQKIVELETELSQLKRAKSIINNNENINIDNNENYSILSNEGFEVLLLSKLTQIINILGDIKEINLDNNRLLKEISNNQKISIPIENNNENIEKLIDITSQINDHIKENNNYNDEEKEEIKEVNNTFLPIEYDDKSIKFFGEENHENWIHLNSDGTLKEKHGIDDIYYIPKQYLLKLIPFGNNRINYTKAAELNIPIYNINVNTLKFPFDNILIDFNKNKIEIIEQVNKKIRIINEELAQKIIDMINMFIDDDMWSSLDHNNKYSIISMIYSKINN